MKNLVRYSVIRFMPFAETQEFANVGIVLHAPNSETVLFKLANKRFSRVSQFFDDLDGQLYSNAIDMFDAELRRIQNLAHDMHGKNLVMFMNEATRPREGFLTFSETAVLLTQNTLTDVLEQLFLQYVGRNFNTKEHREILLAQELKRQLNSVSQYKYKKQTLDTGYMSFDLPLVARDSIQTKAVKPMSFNQSDSLRLIDHGARWILRVKNLIDSNVIKSEDFLFAVEHPEFETSRLENAFQKVEDDMNELGVKVYRADDLDRINTFARFQSEDINNFRLLN
ncbi:DUF3037 domain-containing protein [Celerinatantimonas sp. YJH-8]|uniref:DUF3037 domain-containing protein n=1 Tax=Celerinatantimonas sp. YJH-8 TaxID=3228714 RepID=UPI0038C36004